MRFVAGGQHSQHSASPLDAIVKAAHFSRHEKNRI